MMAITYPLAMPVSPAPTDAELYIERNQIKLESYSSLSQIQRAPGDRWVGRITLPMLSLDQAADWLGFFDALEGQVGSFRMPHPDFKAPRGSAGHEVGAVKGAGQTGSTLETDGWPANQGTLFRRGDMIEVAGKLKRITQDVSSDSSGNATLPVSPAFYSAPPNNAVIRTENPAGTFRLSDTAVVPLSDILKLHRIAFAVEEVLP